MSSASNDANIANLLQQLVDQGSIDPMSETLRDSLEEFIKSQTSIVDSQKLTVKEIRELHTSVKRFLDVVGVQTSQQFKGLLSALKEGASKQVVAGANISEDRLLDAFANRIASSIIQSQKANERGVKGAHLKGDLESGDLSNIVAELTQKMGASAAIDSAANKLINFMSEQEAREQKKQKGFVDDLLEGIEKSTLGGMMKDTFTIIGLMGGQWLKSTLTKLAGPEMARNLAAGFTVAFTAIAPALTSAIFSGMASFLSTRLALKSFGIGATTAGGAAGAGFISTTRSFLGKAAGIGASIFSMAEAADSWQSGNKGQAVALGLGSILTGLGTITPPFLMPIKGILLGIGLTLTTLTTIWKNWGDKIKEFLGGIWDKTKKDEVAESAATVASASPTVSSSSSGVVTRGVGAVGGSASTPVSKSGSFGKLKLGKHGEMTNLRSFTQSEASDAINQYIDTDPVGFYSLYELLDETYADLSQFSNDAIVERDGRKYAVVGRGASEAVDRVRTLMMRQGAPESKAMSFRITSGMATKNSKHMRGGWFSHDNPFGKTLDFGTGGTWTQDDYIKYNPSVQKALDFYGYTANYEYKHRFTTPEKAYGPGTHYHAPANLKKEDFLKSIELNRFRTMSLPWVYSRDNPEEYKKIVEEEGGFYGEDYDKIMNRLEEKAKEAGYARSKEGNWELPKASKALDPTGNTDFQNVQLTLSKLSTMGC